MRALAWGGGEGASEGRRPCGEAGPGTCGSGSGNSYIRHLLPDSVSTAALKTLKASTASDFSQSKWPSIYCARVVIHDDE